MEKLDILVTGVGGQGVVLASDIIGEAALAAGYDVKKTDTLGMAQRGGSVVSNVRIGSHVSSPMIKEGEVALLLAFEKLEAARWSHLLCPDGIAIINDYEQPPLSVSLGQGKYPTDEEITVALKRRTDRIIVTNSADTPLKGLRYLLQAVSDVARKRNLRLVVVGQPKKDGDIPSLIQELGIGGPVEFTGRIRQEDLVHHYAEAAAAVVPSVYEGFGLPAGEAMACGVPVISTRGGALPEVVGDAGLLVPPADAAALATAIETLLRHPDYAARLAQKGLNRVQRHFTWQRAAEKTTAVYRRAMHADC